MYDPIKVVSDFAGTGRGMPDRINKIFRIYTKSSMLLEFSRGAQGVSPIRRLYEPEAPPVRVGVLLGSAGQGASK